MIAELEVEHPEIKNSMIRALANVAPRHLLDRRLHPLAESREIVERAGHAECGPHPAHRSLARCAAKILDLRIFADTDGRMNRSVVETSGSVLVVSQFMLLLDSRPSLLRGS